MLHRSPLVSCSPRHPRPSRDWFDQVVSAWSYSYRTRIDQSCQQIRIYPGITDTLQFWNQMQSYSEIIRRRRPLICRLVLEGSGYDADQGTNVYIARFIMERLSLIAQDRTLRYRGDALDQGSIERHLIHAARMVSERSRRQLATPNA